MQVYVCILVVYTLVSLNTEVSASYNYIAFLSFCYKGYVEIHFVPHTFIGHMLMVISVSQYLGNKS